MSRVQTSSPALLKKSTGAGNIGVSGGLTVQHELDKKGVVVEVFSDLAITPAPSAGMIVYLKQHTSGGKGGLHFQDTVGTITNNGGTLINNTVTVGRHWKAINYEALSVYDFGAIGDGVTDDTLAFQLAAATGGSFTAGAGHYVISGGIQLATVGQVFSGESAGATVLLVVGSGYDVFQLLANNTEAHRFRCYAATHRTSGAYVRIPNPTRGNVISHFYMQNGFRGISITAESVITDISVGEILDTTPSDGVSIYIDGGNDTYINQVVTDNNPAAQPMAGLHIRSSQAVWVTNCDFIHSGKPILIDPDGAAGDLITWCFFSGVACDTSTGAGLEVNPINGGTVRGLFFDNCWFSTNNRGALITHDGTAAVDGVFFTDCTFYNNALQGALVVKGNTVEFNTCRLAGNSGSATGVSAGIDFGVGVQNFSVVGTRSGAHAGFGASQSYGILIGTGCDGYKIIGNTLTGNATLGGIDLSQATSVAKIRNSNLGWVDEAIVTSGNSIVPAGTSVLTVNHGLSGTPTSVIATPSNVNLGAASPWWTGSFTSTTFNINTAANVAANSPFSWEAKK